MPLRRLGIAVAAAAVSAAVWFAPAFAATRALLVGVSSYPAESVGDLQLTGPKFDVALMIETLRYSDEVQKPEAYFAEVPESKPDKELLSLAEELIERKTKPFDPKAFSDPYEAALRELIDAKMENRPPEDIEEPQIGAKVIDLMEALKRSVGGTKTTTSKKAAASAKKPPEKKAPAKSSGSSEKSSGTKKTGSGRRAA